MPCSLSSAAKHFSGGSHKGYLFSDVENGILNYSLFKKFHFYRWPLWLCSSLNVESKAFRPVTPPFLINNYYREWLDFTNFLSSKHVMVDPAGMVSPEHYSWSIELWVLHNNELYRPQHDLPSIDQKRDSQTGLIKTEWKTNNFILTSELYGTRTAIDEAIIDVTCSILTKPSGSSMILVFRPYNNDRIGGINHIEFRESDKTARINKKDVVHISKNPREVFTGNGSLGDVHWSDSSNKSHSSQGMSSMGLLYPIKKEGLNIKIRLSLSVGKPVDPLKLNYQNVKKDFLDYLHLMRSKGFSTSLKDTFFSDWLANCKLIALGQVNKVSSILRSGSIENESSKKAYFLLKSLSRMGYSEESEFLIKTWFKALHFDEPLLFSDAINICYFISSYTDYYIIMRDTEFLKDRFENIQGFAASLIAVARDFIKKNIKKISNNPITGNFDELPPIHDVLLLAHSLLQYAYLARTIGLFGEEIKFSSEAKKLNDYIRNIFIRYTSFSENQIKEIGAISDPSMPLDDYFGLATFSLFPYSNESLKVEDHVALFKIITSFYKKFPIFIKSIGGIDVFLSFMLANNLLLLNDNRSLDIADFLLAIGSGKYSLPDYLHPVNLTGIHGEGESGLVNSSVFLLLRNMLFTEYPNRLELFPCPRREWFTPGSEFTVENAPSRFGMINFKVVCTINEIQIYFTELPKFIPPDILIHLPFDTTLKDGDDFVLKKETGESYVINGWPSVIRFGRK